MSGRRDGVFCISNRRRHDLFYGISILHFKFKMVGAEGIRRHHVRSRIEVLPVDLRDDLRSGKIPCFRKFAGLQTPGLQKASHTSVKINSSLLHQFQNSHGSLLSSSTYLLNAQSFFPHASHPSITQAAGARLTPITAVTDFDGIIR